MANDDTSQDRRAQLAEHLRSADANADGYIDREEAEATLPRVARNFDRIDANQDDKLSFEEFKAAGERMGAMQRRRAR